MVKFVEKKPEEEKPDTANSAFATGLTGRVIENVLGIPNALIGLNNSAIDAAGGVLGPGVAEFLLGDKSEKFNTPSGREVLAGGDAAIGVLGGDFNVGERFQSELAQREQEATDNPTASMLGGFSGDVATLLTGRLPRTGPGGLFDKKIADALSSGSKALGKKAGATGVVKQAKDILDTDVFKHAARGAGRVFETGVEGAALSLLQDGDPVETAAFAAGGQLVASGALAAAEGAVELPLKVLGKNTLGPLGKKAVGIAAQGVILSTLFKVLQSNPDAAEETAFDKLTTALVVGGAAGILGKRSKEGGLLENFPSLADAILTVPRTGMIKAAQAIADDEDSQAVVGLMASDPEAFTAKQLERLQEGIESGNFPEAVQELSADDDFRAATGLNKSIRFVPVD